jgi:hypothetical protein
MSNDEQRSVAKPRRSVSSERFDLSKRAEEEEEEEKKKDLL